MIEKIVSAKAKEAGIEIFGFTENAFVALFPYYVNEKSGNVSMYARGLDYHMVVKEMLFPVAEKIVSLGAKHAEVHSDNGKYNDREAAYKAGLGFYGKNGMLINDKYGSYFFIGQIVCDLSFKPGKPLKKTCLGCGKCLEACITGTLKEGYSPEKCLSGISQKKGCLTKEEEEYIKVSGMCWGCDRCQQVCPHNKNLETTPISDFLKERILNLSPIDLDGLSERKFKEKYKKYAFSWRGVKVLRRNLEILRNCDEEKRDL